MTREPVHSSNIKAIGYDPDTRELHVEFKGGGVFCYDGVSAAQHAALMAAPSHGAYLHAKIKTAHKCRKV